VARARYLLLLLPFLAYLYPAWYDRIEPRLFGFPFFYWYQLLWVLLTSLAIGAVIWLRRGRR
jgi:hypothetical protein